MIIEIALSKKQIMPLSLKQVRYFIATADSGQVSLAAMQLNVSQSAVTSAIKQLEETLGVALFRRHASGVSLTAEGARFLTHARNIMAVVGAAERAPLTEDAAMAGHVKVGVTYTVAGYFLPRYYARFRRANPRVTVELVELPRTALEERLMDGTLDMAVMLVSNLGERKHLAYETLLRSRRRLWLPAEHPLLSKETVTLNDVASEPYAMLTVDEASQTAERYWKPTGLEPSVIFRTSSVEAVRSFVADGIGVTILSDMVYRPWSLEGQRIELRNIVADIPSMDIGIAWHPGQDQSPATRRFHEFLSLSFSGALSQE